MERLDIGDLDKMTDDQLQFTIAEVFGLHQRLTSELQARLIRQIMKSDLSTTLSWLSITTLERLVRYIKQRQ